MATKYDAAANMRERRIMARGEQMAMGCDLAHVPNYMEQYDAFYCPECDVWLDTRCNDPMCGFCTRLPASPSRSSNLGA